MLNYANSGTGGPQPSFTATGTSGTLDVIWTDTNSPVEERDAFFFVNMAWHNMMLHNPTETLFNTPLNDEHQLHTATCNAFYTTSPLSMNFYSAGGGCINTANEASVPVHEYGHHVTADLRVPRQDGPGKPPGGLLRLPGGRCSTRNIIGDDWQGPGTSVRN